MDRDTIVAISTPNGTGAIGIIRVSGTLAFPIATKVLVHGGFPFNEDSLRLKSRKSLYVGFQDPVTKNLLDRILFIGFSKPHTYTGEDLCEYHFHGNPILLRSALEVICKSGARPAMPGEFTKRAYSNGKMDLTEAEAVRRIIHSRSRLELELARKNYFGEISKLSSRLRSELIGLKAEFEAEIDFSTEDLTYETREERSARIRRIIQLTETVIEKSARTDRLIGKSKVVLIGEPNAGKSSLLNLLIGRERAITSPIPGTTRDYISEDLQLSGIPIQLIDTAGLRETKDEIEQLGIEKTLQEVRNANLCLYLIDMSQDRDWKEFMRANREILRKSVLVANKLDSRSPSWSEDEWRVEFPDSRLLSISCRTGEGVEELISVIQEELAGKESSEEFVLLEDRQKYHFQRMVESLSRADELIQTRAPAEIVIEEINESLHEVSNLLGEISTEEILGRIFSTFCVGK